MSRHKSIVCLHCGKSAMEVARKLCSTCYRSDVRDQYPPQPPSCKTEKKQCAECKRMLCLHCRGLCGKCYNDLEIRAKHRQLRETRPEEYLDSMSQEEVDKLIAEQSANLPEWFLEDQERQEKYERRRQRVGIMLVNLWKVRLQNTKRLAQ